MDKKKLGLVLSIIIPAVLAILKVVFDIEVMPV